MAPGERTRNGAVDHLPTGRHWKISLPAGARQIEIPDDERSAWALRIKDRASATQSTPLNRIPMMASTAQITLVILVPANSDTGNASMRRSHNRRDAERT
jgi:hypothetical protein